MIKREKRIFSFNHYVHYTIIKREKSFFHLITTITTPWSREKKVLFSFNHYVHYTMIERQKVFLFHLVTTFTTPWSRETYFFISALHSLRHGHKKKKLHYYVDYVRIIKKISFFNFTMRFTMQVSSCISLCF